MFSPQQQIMLECFRGQRFAELMEFEIDELIPAVHRNTLNLFARYPYVVDRVLDRRDAIRKQAWIICGVEAIKLCFAGETVEEFLTRDIVVFNADVKDATRPMTIATPVVENAPVSASTAALEQTIEPSNKLFTIEQLSEIAHKAGRYDLEDIKSEILALNPEPWDYGGTKLYSLSAAEQAIRNLSSDVIQRTRTIAAQWDTKAEAKTEVKASAKPKANKSTAQRRSTAAKGRTTTKKAASKQATPAE